MDASSAALQQVIAAWVQAIGSIGAIAGAVWIASRQTKAVERLRRKDTVDRLASISAVLNMAHEKVAEFHEEIFRLPANNHLVFPSAATVIAAKAATLAVSKMSTRDTPTPKSVVALIAAQISIAKADGNWPLTDGQFHIAWTNDIKRLHTALVEAHIVVDEETQRLRAER